MDGIFLSLTSPSSIKILGMSAQTKSPPLRWNLLWNITFSPRASLAGCRWLSWILRRQQWLRPTEEVCPPHCCLWLTRIIRSAEDKLWSHTHTHTHTHTHAHTLIYFDTYSHHLSPVLSSLPPPPPLLGYCYFPVSSSVFSCFLCLLSSIVSFSFYSSDLQERSCCSFSFHFRWAWAVVVDVWVAWSFEWFVVPVFQIFTCVVHLSSLRGQVSFLETFAQCWSSDQWFCLVDLREDGVRWDPTCVYLAGSEDSPSR